MQRSFVRNVFKAEWAISILTKTFVLIPSMVGVNVGGTTFLWRWLTVSAETC